MYVYDDPFVYDMRRFGPNSNNTGRYHNLQQAKEADQRGLEIYLQSHPRCFVIKNDNGIEGKVREMCHILANELVK